MKIPDITNLVPNTTLNAKVNEIKREYLVLQTTIAAALNAKINDLKGKNLILLT